MRKIICSMLIFLALSNAPAVAFAVDAPISLTHTLASSLAGPTSLTLYFTLHLQNRTKETLTNLELAFVPLPPFFARDVVFKVPTLGPHEAADLTLAVTAQPQQNAEALARAQLYFTGKGLDGQGRPVEFPATSRHGKAGGAI